MLKKIEKLILSNLIIICAVLFVGVGALAPVDNASSQTDILGLDYGEETGLTRDDPRTVVARTIQVALGLLGILATVLIIYAGFKWMTAGGNEENVTSAKKILFASVIGLLIILSAYAVSNFVLKSLYESTTGQAYR